MDDSNDFIASLFSSYHDKLARYCYRFVNYNPKYTQLVDDCIQEAFYLAVKNREAFLSSKNPYGWLALCCRHYFQDAIRRHKIHVRITGIPVSYEQCCDTVSVSDDIIRWLCREDAQFLLGMILESLSPSEKQIFADYYVHSLSLAETAAANHTTVGSVRGAVQRIRSKAKSIYAGSLLLITFFLLSQCIFPFLYTI